MRLHHKIQLTAELCGRPMSDAAVAMMTSELERHDPAGVAKALDRVAREGGRFTLAAVVSRLPGTAPSPDEAWAIACNALDEAKTVVLTDAINAATGVVRHMTDMVAARMAFREAYARFAADDPMPKWWATLGHDVHGRHAALKAAVETGLLPSSELRQLAPPEPYRALPECAPMEPGEVATLGTALVDALRGGA